MITITDYIFTSIPIIVGVLWIIIFYKDFKKEPNNKNKRNFILAISIFLYGLYELCKLFLT